MVERKINEGGLLDNQSLSHLFRPNQNKIMFGKKKNFQIPGVEETIQLIKKQKKTTFDLVSTFENSTQSSWALIVMKNKSMKDKKERQT